MMQVDFLLLKDSTNVNQHIVVSTCRVIVNNKEKFISVGTLNKNGINYFFKIIYYLIQEFLRYRQRLSQAFYK